MQKAIKVRAIYSILFFIIFGFHYTSKAQTATSSPYSRYGIGDVNTRNYSQSFAMGGTNIAVQNDTLSMFFINNANPASYSNMRLTTAELGLNFTHLTLQSSSTKKSINSASPGYISLAFPLYKKWWGASFGLIPYSSVGYKISDHQELTNIGGVDDLYEGTGGINQVYFGNGIKPFAGFKKLKHKKTLSGISLGFNVSYLFGKIDNTRRSIFSSSSNSFNTKTGTTTRISDLYLDYGLQYSYTIDSVKKRELKEKVKLLFGATFAAQTNISAKIDSLSTSYVVNSSGYELPKDTIEYSQNKIGTVTFPLSFGVGFGFKKGDRWLVVADFAMQNWSSYQAFNQTQGLKNSMRVSIGTQYVPNNKANGKGDYYKRVYYRIGARYGQTAIELKNTQLTEYAVSAGFGLPVGRNYLMQSFSLVNIGVEFGERGTTTNNLIKEQFFKINVGFTINDRWFVKPKFD